MADWGDGLYIRDALQQFVAGTMLIELFRRDTDVAGAFADDLAGAAIYDVSVGYDLAGIRRDRVRGFLESMRSAAAVVEHLRGQIPREFTFARRHSYPMRIASQLTIATRPATGADEISRIAELLIGQHGFDVYLKLSPTTLERDQLAHLLHETLGFRQLNVPQARRPGMLLAEAIDVCRQLSAYARQCGRGFGLKVANALPVVGRRPPAPPAETTRYLSGKPLHVISLTLASELRKRLGPDVPIGFSGGVDRHNFAAAVACGFSPVSACTDLLRPGGYGRLGTYLTALIQDIAARQRSRNQGVHPQPLWPGRESGAARRSRKIGGAIHRNPPRGCGALGRYAEHVAGGVDSPSEQALSRAAEPAGRRICQGRRTADPVRLPDV